MNREHNVTMNIERNTFNQSSNTIFFVLLQFNSMQQLYFLIKKRADVQISYFLRKTLFFVLGNSTLPVAFHGKFPTLWRWKKLEDRKCTTCLIFVHSASEFPKKYKLTAWFWTGIEIRQEIKLIFFRFFLVLLNKTDIVLPCKWMNFWV